MLKEKKDREKGKFRRKMKDCDRKQEKERHFVRNCKTQSEEIERLRERVCAKRKR